MWGGGGFNAPKMKKLLCQKAAEQQTKGIVNARFSRSAEAIEKKRGHSSREPFAVVHLRRGCQSGQENIPPLE